MSVVTGKKIAADLGSIGLEPGSIVLVHCSLSSLGHVPGGEQAVVSALHRQVGNDGTIVVPTQSWQLCDPAYLDDPAAEGSPPAALYRLGASILLLGVGFSKCTALHLAQSRSRIPTPRLSTAPRCRSMVSDGGPSSPRLPLTTATSTGSGRRSRRPCRIVQSSARLVAPKRG